MNYRLLCFFHGWHVAILAHAITKDDVIPTADERFDARSASKPNLTNTPTRSRSVAKRSRRTSDARRVLDRITGDDPTLQTLIEEQALNVRVAEMIHAARNAAGLTQTELADRLGTTQSVISRLENADYDGHSLTMLERIARALGQRLDVRSQRRSVGVRHLRVDARAPVANDPGRSPSGPWQSGGLGTMCALPPRRLPRGSVETAMGRSPHCGSTSREDRPGVALSRYGVSGPPGSFMKRVANGLLTLDLPPAESIPRSSQRTGPHRVPWRILANINRPLLISVAAVAVSALFLVACAAQVAPPTDRQDAIQILQGISTTAKIDPARIVKIEKWIGKIRKAHPKVRKIRALPRVELGTVILIFDRKAKQVLARAKWKIESGRLLLQGKSGIAALDKLQKELGARLHHLGPSSVIQMCVARFDRELVISTVCRRYQALTEVEKALPNTHYGDGDDIILKPRGAKLLFVFKRGWGDCLAGCIHNHYYYFEVDTAAGTITKRGELKDADSQGGAIIRWGVPARFAVKPFADFDAVLKAAAHDDWWVALHAVEVIGTMLSGAKEPWLRVDEGKRVRFDRVLDGVKNRPGAAHRVLVRGLGHDDPDVRDSALRQLRRIGKLDHGGDADGIRAWRAWLKAKRFDK